jgi:hypothetical protein
MYVLYTLAAVAVIALIDWLWLRSAPPKPTVLVPKTGIELPPTVSSKPVEPLRNQITNIRWRINQ